MGFNVFLAIDLKNRKRFVVALLLLLLSLLFLLLYLLRCFYLFVHEMMKGRKTKMNGVNVVSCLRFTLRQQFDSLMMTGEMKH